jgi:hypothetical protein
MEPLLTSDFADAQKAQALVREVAFHTSMQIIIRAILLKLNSKEAHSAMKDQLLEQVRAVAKIWVEQERGTLRESFANDLIRDKQLDLIEKRLSELEGALVREACGHIEAMFAPPEDVAGLY